MTKNIFDFAPHELNHSAFWAWILASLEDNKEKTQNKIRIRIASNFIKKVGIAKSDMEKISIEHQSSPKTHKNSEKSTYDIKIEIDKKKNKVLLVIETKVKAEVGIPQLEKYMNSIERECKKAERTGYLILLDIQGKSPLEDKDKKELMQKAKKKNIIFKSFTPAELIEIIKKDIKINTKNDRDLINNYLKWIEGNRDFWEYIFKSVVYKISEKENKNVEKPTKRKGWGWTLKSKKVGIGEVGIIFEEELKQMNVECYFGDTDKQITEIFKNCEIIRNNLKKLENNGWKIEPNLYFCTSMTKRHYPQQQKDWKNYFNIVYNADDSKNIKYSAEDLKNKFIELHKREAIKDVNFMDDTRRNSTRNTLEDDIKKIGNKKTTLKRGIAAKWEYKIQGLLDSEKLKKLNSEITNKINDVLEDLPSKAKFQV